MNLLNRRLLLTSIFFIITGALLQFFKFFDFIFQKNEINFRFVRPPGSRAESKFLSECIRCRACANVCEAGCIKFFSLSDGFNLAGTPYLNTRLRACNLCMNCTQICPTGALKPIERDIEAISKEVSMGVAEVIPSNCLSFNGRICGVCHDACPLPGKAIKLVTRAQPEVIADACIGCGRCEERCPQTPAAIIVYSKEQSHA